VNQLGIIASFTIDGDHVWLSGPGQRRCVCHLQNNHKCGGYSDIRTGYCGICGHEEDCHDVRAWWTA